MKKLLLATAITLTLGAQAKAYDRNNIMFGLGVDNLRKDEHHDQFGNEGDFRAQWRGKAFDKEALAGIDHISPFAGVDVDTGGATAIYAGFLYDWNFYGGWSLVPNIGVGAYFHGGGKDLGGPLEFHDSIDLNYAIDSVSRVGISLTHMSNASIYSHNPGKEDLMATYSFGY